MRKLTLAVLLAMAGSFAVAQEPSRDQAGPSVAKSKKEMTAIVVATDATVKTITVRREKSEPGSQPETLSVAGAAVAHLGSIKTGEKVKLVLTMDPATNKESVTSIEKPKDTTPPSDK